MRAIRSGCAFWMVLGLVLPLSAGELGDKAAALKVKEWVKGESVDVTAKGDQVYVVEFWATWCGPCVESIPHLSELQQKFKGKVTFVGVSTDSASTVEQVKPFVEKMGDKMNYTVAIDKDGGTAEGYMAAFGIRGIPHAFVVQNGKIVWQQNPHPASYEGDLGEVLDLVVAGKFDKAAVAKRQKAVELRLAEQKKTGAYVQEYLRLVSSKGNTEEAAALGKKLLDVAGDNANLLNSLAWEVLTSESIVDRDLQFALRVAEAANKASKGESAAILDTYGLALFENGKKAEAIKVQEKAVKLAKKTGPEGMLKELEERLEKFRNEP